MSNISFSLDYIKATFAWDGKVCPVLTVGVPTKVKKEIKGQGSYNSGYECENFNVYFHTEDNSLRVLFQMTGLNLSDYRASGGDEIALIDTISGADGRFTRIDFAVDLFDTGAIPDDMLNCWLCDQVYTVAQSVMILERREKRKSLGQTVYVGSRTSERFVRVYDKAKQKGLKIDWVRVEIEVKGKRSIQFGEMLRRACVKTGGLAMLADFIEWTDVEWFNSMWGEDYEVVKIESIGKPETDRDKWLRSVVVPVIERELAAGNDWLYATLDALMLSHEDKQGHGPRLTVPH